MDEEGRFSRDRIHSAYDLNYIHRLRKAGRRRSRFYEHNRRTYDRCTNESVSPYDLSTMHELMEERRNAR